MQYIVLGLLILKSMTIYELNQAFGQGISIIYAASYGNLQYAVKKLIADNKLTFEEKVENGRNKKIYHINELGVEDFFRWMNKDADSKRIETVMLGKVYFLGLVESKEDKIKIIDNLIAASAENSKGLFNIKELVDNIGIPEEHKEIAKYQISTLDYGIGEYEYTRKWLLKLRRELG